MDAEQSLQEFLEFVIGALIDHPDQASITRRLDTERGTLYFDATLEEGDVGRIIGKNGFVISSIRSLLDASGEKHGLRVRFKLHSVTSDGGRRSVDENRR
jgi:hypothetical protein